MILLSIRVEWKASSVSIVVSLYKYFIWQKSYATTHNDIDTVIKYHIVKLTLFVLR